jgi:DNA-binding XRE family transcriptional regulator
VESLSPFYDERRRPDPLRAARLLLGLSQAELAASAGISREQRGGLETGRVTPMLRTALAVATALVVHVSTKGFSGTSAPSGGTTSASGTPTDPRDQTAAERGYLSWAELSRLSQAEIAKVRQEAPELYAEGFRQLQATRACDSSQTPVHWSDGTAA